MSLRGSKQMIAACFMRARAATRREIFANRAPRVSPVAVVQHPPLSSSPPLDGRWISEITIGLRGNAGRRADGHSQPRPGWMSQMDVPDRGLRWMPQVVDDKAGAPRVARLRPTPEIDAINKKRQPWAALGPLRAAPRQSAASKTGCKEITRSDFAGLARVQRGAPSCMKQCETIGGAREHLFRATARIASRFAKNAGKPAVAVRTAMILMSRAEPSCVSAG